MRVGELVFRGREGAISEDLGAERVELRLEADCKSIEVLAEAAGRLV
jgi:hypothetical protein